MTHSTMPEFSCVVRPSALVAEDARQEFDIEANPTQCAGLASRFGFLALDNFRVSVRLRPVRGNRDFQLHGRIKACVVQSCVVTLDPVTSEIDHDFDLLLREDVENDEKLVEIEDDFELFSDDAIDIGEIAAVELALSVDPYPRAPGVSVGSPGPESAGGESDEQSSSDPQDEKRRNRPFEALAALKRNK